MQQLLIHTRCIALESMDDMTQKLLSLKILRTKHTNSVKKLCDFYLLSLVIICGIDFKSFDTEKSQNLNPGGLATQ